MHNKSMALSWMKFKVVPANLKANDDKVKVWKVGLFINENGQTSVFQTSRRDVGITSDLAVIPTSNTLKGTHAL